MSRTGTWVLLSVLLAVWLTAAVSATPPDGPILHGPLLTDVEAWKKLPRAAKGSEQPLPTWARALAPTLPHTTAAMLELDYRHRALGPLEPKLRARVRWVAARALQSVHGEAIAAADLRRAGGSAADLRVLAGNRAGLPEAERLALTFAEKLAARPHAVTDAEVARLVRYYGECQVVGLALHVAYAGFQDRLLRALELPAVADGSPPIDVRFPPPPLGTRLARPRKGPARTVSAPRARPNEAWRQLDLAALDRQMRRQQQSRPRVRLPEGSAGANRWGLVCRTYQPELAAGWTVCRDRFGAEANQEAIFEACVFWVVARAQESFY